MTSVASHFAGALYSDFLTQGLSYFFVAARLEADGVQRRPRPGPCAKGRLRGPTLTPWGSRGWASAIVDLHSLIRGHFNLWKNSTDQNAGYENREVRD